MLAHSYEYRPPSQQKLADSLRAESAMAAGSKTVAVDMTSRYLGLIVVPGHHIVKIEVEEFLSQMKSAR